MGLMFLGACRIVFFKIKNPSLFLLDDNGEVKLKKEVGKIANLEELIKKDSMVKFNSLEKSFCVENGKPRSARIVKF